MTGPCLCGDPYCGSCFPGNDGGALEEAEVWASETFANARLTVEEYKVAVSVGLAAVHHARKAVKANMDAALQAAKENADIAMGMTHIEDFDDPDKGEWSKKGEKGDSN